MGAPYIRLEYEYFVRFEPAFLTQAFFSPYIETLQMQPLSLPPHSPFLHPVLGVYSKPH